MANQRQVEAKVAQAQAQRDYQRAQALQATGAIPLQDREIAALNQTTKAKELAAAQLAVKAAANEVGVAQAALTVLQQQQSDADYLLKVYDARITSVEAELAKLKDEAALTNITSPVNGRILRILQKSTQFVTARIFITMVKTN
jgi:HlyD family secretion protein